MSRSPSLLRNVFSNVGAYAVSIAAAFLIAPITIHTLGDARYGAWSLVSELIGYYGLLDLGIRGAVTYYVARHSARDDGNAVRETVSTAFWILLACGTATFLVGLGLTAAFPHLFRTEGVDLAEVRWALLIMSGLIGASLPMNVFTGGLVGRQRFDIVTGIDVVDRILTTAAVYLAMKNGGGLIALALIQVAGRLLAWGMILFACRRVLGGVFARPSWFRRDRVRDLLGYGFRNAVGQVAMLVIYRVDLTVVGIFAGMGRVTRYTIAGTLVSYAWTLCSSITYSFTPRFTQLQSSNAEEEMRRLYLVGMRMTGMVVTFLSAGMLVFGSSFIRLWLGEAYVTGPWTDRSDVIMTILIVANVPRMLQSISWQRLYAMARVRFLMWLNLGEAAMNLTLSVFLVRQYGPAGVALGTLFPLLVSHLLVMPIYSSRAFGIPLRHIFLKGLAVPLLTGIMTGGAGWVLVRVAPPDRWPIFMLDVALTTAVGALLCGWLGLTKAEREDHLWRRLRPTRSDAPH